MNLRHVLIKKHDCFDLYFFDCELPERNKVFQISDCPYDAVSFRWDEKRVEHYLDFKLGNTTVTFVLKIPVQHHMKLLGDLGLLND